jgi:hypothetical protein
MATEDPDVRPGPRRQPLPPGAVGHRDGDHRRWMLRSVALTFSIVLNRVWLVAFFLLFTPFLGDDPAALGLAAAGASVWTSWVVNLLVVEPGVLRPHSRPHSRPRRRAV